MKDTLIVNLYGGPGSGKSTGAAYLFAKLKMAGVDAEYVTEFAKDKVWEGNQEAFRCQFYITGKQTFRISRCFGKVDVIVTDSPLLLGKIYANLRGLPILGNACVEAAKQYEGHTLDVIVRRTKKYNPNGRNQTEEEARGIDVAIRNMLGYYNVRASQIDGDDEGYASLFSLVMNTLKDRRIKKEANSAGEDKPQFLDFPGRKVVKNGIYRHFKGKYYLVEDIANHSETGEEMVVYRHLYGDGGLCVRPKAMFLSEVDHVKYPDVKQLYRFELVDEFKEEADDKP
jgi:Uncharacterized protein conserved in bacteria